jgi:hypothetical protein
MIGPTQSITRRSVLLSTLIAPLACLGCGGPTVEVDTKAGEKRRQKMEDLQKKANPKRNPKDDKAP